jgi:hypothetical protein
LPPLGPSRQIGKTRRESGQEAQTFWTEFLAVFGIHRRRAHAAFDRHARRLSTGGPGFIDLIWPGMVLAEHKSAGEDLEAAADQALDYLDSLPDLDLPRLILVSDFARIGVMDPSSRLRVWQKDRDPFGRAAFLSHPKAGGSQDSRRSATAARAG